jgi:alpha-D-ribose 1-methylphosphonate 5-triphosphate synthase subunit PhnL
MRDVTIVAGRERPSPVIDVRGLGKHFTMHLRYGLELQVLRDVSFGLYSGECVAIIGPSGRGKSTLMKCLYGNYGIDCGQVVFECDQGTIDLAAATPQQILRLRSRELSYVSQFLRVVPRVSALDVVAQRLLESETTAPGVFDDEAYVEHLERSREAARSLFARLRLPAALWSLPPATFSGGEQQRVNIARGFIVPPRLLLLDEPTASLDATNRAIVIDLIEEAKARGTAVIGIFHDEAVRDSVATRCLELD